MKFYFCETCGKRLTENDVAGGQARDKKLRGVFCSDCAQGVMTMESLPLSDAQAQALLEQPGAKPATRRSSGAQTLPSSGQHRVPPSSGQHRVQTESGMQARVAGGAPRARGAGGRAGQVASSGSPALPLALAGGAALLAGAAFLLFGGAPEPQPPRGDPPQFVREDSPAAPAPVPVAPPPARPEPAEPPKPAPEPAPELNREQAAQAAFEKLQAEPRDTPEARDELKRKLEAYVAEFGETIVSVRARRLLNELNAPDAPPPVETAPQPAEPAQTPEPSPPAAAAAPDAAGWTSLFDGASLGGWKRGPKSGDFAVKDGAIERIPGPSGFLDHDGLPGDWELEFQAFLGVGKEPGNLDLKLPQGVIDFVAGKREIPANAWFTVRMTKKGTAVQTFVNGKPYEAAALASPNAYKLLRLYMKSGEHPIRVKDLRWRTLP
ncbi:MAG: DUF1080 domain-containing protein [Planctomycetota bacterium]|nr:DUF1080 domain-containing protein [Planctomycetota bacterium]